MYQGNQLPFSINSLQAQEVFCNPGNPPFRLQINCSPQTQQYLPLIITACIDHIQGNSRKNELRLFLFNQMAQNGYNNQSFSELITVICAVIDYRLSSNMGININQVIPEIISVIVETFAAKNLQTFQALQQMVNPALLQAASQTLNSGTMLINQAMNVGVGYRQSAQQPMFSTQMNPQRQPYQNNYPGNTVFSTGNNFQSPMLFGNNDGTDVGSRWSSNRADEPAKQPATPFRFDSDLSAASNKQIIGFPSEAIPNSDDQEMINRVAKIRAFLQKEGRFGDIVHWSIFPYHGSHINRAFDPNNYDLFYLVDGTNSPSAIIFPLDKNTMDKSAHFFTPRVAPATMVITAQRALEENQPVINEKLEEENKVLRVAVATETPTDIVTVTICDNEVWMKAANQLAQTDISDEIPTVSKIIASVNVPVIYNSKLEDFCSSIMNCKSFAKAVHLLGIEKTKASNNQKEKIPRYLINEVNARLTKTLQDFLHKKLGIPVEISSFYEDANEILKYVKDNHPIYSDAIFNQQESILNESVNLCGDDVRELIASAYLNEDEVQSKRNNGLHYFCSLGVFFMLSIGIEELGIEIPKDGTSVSLFASGNPFMNKLCVNMFEYESIYGYNCHRHLIKTIDGTVIRVEKSLITDKHYLISLA